MIQKSRLVRVLIWLFLAGQVVFFALSWSPTLPSVPGLSVQMAPGGMGFDEARGLLTLPRVWGTLVALPSVLALAFGVWRLDLLLRANDSKTMFSVRSIGHLRAFAGATAVSALCSMLEVPLRGWVFRYLGGSLQERIHIGVSSDQLLLLLVCAVFYLVTNLMHEARRIAEENEGFV